MKKVKKIYEMSTQLTRVAMGDTPAETVIKNAKLVNVCTSEIVENIDVAITGGRIALVGDASHCVGADTKIIDANGQYIAPGFLDGHVHIESSMLGVSEYAKAVIPRGTSGVFMDPHEITNVLGLDGMKYMTDDAERTPMKAMVTIPSCVPALEGFEDVNGKVTLEDIKEYAENENIFGLGEMMNYPAILNHDENVHGIVGAMLKAGKAASGHFPVHNAEKELNAYISTGINSCHETGFKDDALMKMRLGMYAMIREGSAWHDLTETIQAITENNIDSRFALLVTDDTHPHTLLEKGHMDHLLRRASEEGMNPIEAIQMITINVATCFRMETEIGSITPGKCADIVFMEDLKDFKVTRTIINGEVVAENGKITFDLDKYIYPENAKNTMKIPSEFTADDFKIKVDTDKNSLDCHIIQAVEAKVYNYEKIMPMKIIDGEIKTQIEDDVLKACVIERHLNTKKSALGLITGFGIKHGAIASTVAHDAHNLLIVGANDEDMALCANTLKASGGGMVACSDGKILGHVPLPIAGLMSDLPIEEVAGQIANLEKAWEDLGCQMVSPFMTMALLSLACIPTLRLTNRGLVDCTTYKFKDLIIAE